jgi:Tfp pilus assembly protein PilZ
MDIRNNKGLNFIIGQWRPLTENFDGGGHLAMHMLAYKLAERNQNVYICCEPFFKHDNITQLECKHDINEIGTDIFTIPTIIYNHNNTISVNTQVTWNNPFNTKNTVRWFMYDTDKPIESTFTNEDVYFNYGNFKTENPHREKGVLTILNYNKDKFFNYNKFRKGYCHILHKNTPNNYNEILNEYNSVDLTDWKNRGGFNYLREEFNKFEYYLTFDDKSYFSIAAVMCGCKVIIIPTEKTKKLYCNYSDFRKQNFHQSIGISYGFDDLQWSENTIKFIDSHIKNLEELDDKTVDDFIKYFKNEK